MLEPRPLHFKWSKTSFLFSAEYAAYAPSIPASISATWDFGKTHSLVVDGFVNDAVSAVSLPNIVLVDVDGVRALDIKIEPSYSRIFVSSAFVFSVGYNEWSWEVSC